MIIINGDKKQNKKLFFFLIKHINKKIQWPLNKAKVCGQKDNINIVDIIIKKTAKDTAIMFFN